MAASGREAAKFAAVVFALSRVRYNAGMVPPTPIPDRRIRKREKYAAGMILENSSLRRELDDTQAEPLIRWALAAVTAAAQRTAPSPTTTPTPSWSSA